MKTLFLFLFLISTQTFATVYIVSDIDETIKQTNLLSYTGVVYQHLYKKPFSQLRSVYHEIAHYYHNRGEPVVFTYLSGSYQFLYDGQKWIKENNFPPGRVFQKPWRNNGTQTFKTEQLRKMFQGSYQLEENDLILFFGDNTEYDPAVYAQVKKELKHRKTYIFIRDVRTNAHFFHPELPVFKIEGVHYFLSEYELIQHPEFFFLSDAIQREIRDLHVKRQLIPGYIYQTLHSRFKKLRKCRVWDRRCQRDAGVEAWVSWEGVLNQI